MAWIASAFVDIRFAIIADDAGNANAFVAAGFLKGKWLRVNRWQREAVRQCVQRLIRSLQAFTVILAWRAFALVNVDFAVLPVVSSVAMALQGRGNLRPFVKMHLNN